jgi:putative membrane protein
MMFAAAAVTVLALGACNKASNETKGAATPGEQAATPNANPAATILTPSNEAAAPDFVAKAASSDMFEVAAGKLAATKAANPEVKKFARMMVQAHTKSTEGLKAAIASSGQTTLAPPAALPSDLQSKLDDLNGKAGADFDKAYMDAMVDGHQSALDLMQRYAQDGDVAAIKQFAAATAPVVQDHLTRAKGIKDGLGKGTADAEKTGSPAPAPKG